MNQSLFERNYLNDDEPLTTKNGATNYCDAVSFSKVHDDHIQSPYQNADSFVVSATKEI